MNRIILTPKTFGDPLIILRSNNTMFDVLEFLYKYYRCVRKQSYISEAEMWRRFMRTNGAAGTLIDLMDRYGVKNYMNFYMAIEDDKDIEMALAHGELIKRFVEQDFNSEFKVELEYDEESRNWKPDFPVPLQRVSDHISDAFISLIPGENIDDKIDWVNNAAYRAALDIKWTSLPYASLHPYDQEVLDKLCKEVSEKIDKGEITSFEELKSHLSNIWCEKNMPDIFK